MRQLTFKGFLASYVEELSYSGTSGISKLVKEVEQNPRIKEPLILYGIVGGMPRGIKKKYPDFYAEYMQVSELLQKTAQPEFCTGILPVKYDKVILAFEYERNKIQRDTDTKMLMWRKITEIQNQKGISNYRIYTDLNINPGNANCFLKHGRVEKMGLDTARRILQYVRDAH